MTHKTLWPAAQNFRKLLYRLPKLFDFEFMLKHEFLDFHCFFKNPQFAFSYLRFSLLCREVTEDLLFFCFVALFLIPTFELVYVNHQACFCENQLYNPLKFFCFPTALHFLHVLCFCLPELLVWFTNLNFFILSTHISIAIFLFLLKHLWVLTTTIKCFFYHHQVDLWKIQLFYHLAWLEWNTQYFSNFQENCMLGLKGT